MPLLSNKLYVLNKIKKDKKDDELVLYQPITNEICADTDELARKTFLYNQTIWTCRITGQINLTFKEALKSEQGCCKILKNSFMKCYEPVVLQFVHHSRDTLESIIHKSWTKIHEEYSVNEPVTIKLTTPKEIILKGIVVKVDRSSHEQDVETDLQMSSNKISSEASSSDKENVKKKIIPLKKSYHYSVKIFEMDKLVHDIPSETIERTLRPPSKHQIRMFIRAHSTRPFGKHVNPWIVDEDFVKKYKLPNVEQEYIIDKLKIREMSRTCEIQTYIKLMEESLKKSSDITNTSVTGAQGVIKKGRKSIDDNSPKKMKQMTLLDLRAAARPVTKIKSPFTSSARTIPPQAQHLLKLMKENKNDPAINQMVLKCCQYTDLQISKLPEQIRVIIREKKDRLELKKKLRNMTPEERDLFMARRRIELRQLLRNKKKEIDTMESDVDNLELIVEGSPICVDKSMTHDQWARLVSISEFVRCFKGLLGPTCAKDGGDVAVSDLCRAVTGTTNSAKIVLAELVCLLLKPLLQDPKLRQRKEVGVILGELPVIASTAGELLKLVLPMNVTEERLDDVEGKDEMLADDSTVQQARLKAPNNDSQVGDGNVVVASLCDKLVECEIYDLSLEEKIVILELLRERVLDLDVIAGFMDDCQREATEAYKKRLVDIKELNDRLKALRADMAEVSVQLATISAESEAASDGPPVDLLPLSTRRRMSLEMRNKEAEERDRRVDLERQYQRMEKDESGYKRQIELAYVPYNTAVTEVKQLMRVQPLGADRLNRRYWVFKTAPAGIYVETEVGDMSVGESVSTSWTVHDSVDSVSLLIASLSERVPRECLLKKELQAILPKLVEEFDELVKEACVPSSSVAEVVAADNTDSPECESFLARVFKEELRETEINIRQGSLGGVADFQQWSEQLMAGTDMAVLKRALTDVFHGVIERFWDLPLKQSASRSEYLAAVDQASTQSRLNVLQCLLDVCVCWSKSASDDKCRVCNKSHREDSMLLCDGCNRAYHTFCLRPPLRTVPDGEWLCMQCRPVEYSESDSESGSRETCKPAVGASVDCEEVCCVCHTDEDGLGKCAGCGSVYHGQCHEPPVRYMRRANWFCSSCPAGAADTGSKRSRYVSDEDEDRRVHRGAGHKRSHSASVDEGQDMEPDVKVAKRTKRVNGLKGKLNGSEREEGEKPRRGRPPGKREKIEEVRANSQESQQRVTGRKSVVSEDQQEACIRTILKQMRSHKSSWPFRQAVDEDEVPDYYTIISVPVDIALLTERHKRAAYRGPDGLHVFLAEVAQMFTNADIYNEPDSDIMRLAADLEHFFRGAYDKYDLGVPYVRPGSSA